MRRASLGPGERVGASCQHLQLRAKQLVEQHIAVEFVIHISLGDRARQDQFAGDAQACAGCGGQARMVGLHAADSNDRINAGLLRRPDMEFEFAQFVAATAQQHVIVALEKQANSPRPQAQQLFEAFGSLNGRGALQKVCSRKCAQGFVQLGLHRWRLADVYQSDSREKVTRDKRIASHYTLNLM
ncbi:hypothetical protein D3C84_518470 [compost metagenome]